jgi:hypothetical protein
VKCKEYIFFPGLSFSCSCYLEPSKARTRLDISRKEIMLQRGLLLPSPYGDSCGRSKKKNSSLRRRCLLRNRCNARVGHVARWTSLPLITTTHRLTSPGVLALLHPLAQYLHVVCPAVSPSDPIGPSLEMGHWLSRAVQEPVAPGPEYHRATPQSLQES